MLLALPYYVAAEAVKHSYTLFLFTRSDIKTTLIPIVSRHCNVTAIY